MTVDNYFHIGMQLAWLPSLIFPLVYGLTAQWWKSIIGRALLINSVGVCLLITFTNLFQILGPDYMTRDTLRVAGITVLVLGLWFQATAIVKAKVHQYRTPGQTVREHEDS